MHIKRQSAVLDIDAKLRLSVKPIIDYRKIFKARLVSEKLNEIRPIFIFSLPRAGSTLVQRVLAAHDDIATTSEPWILLPFLFSTKEQGVYAEYSSQGYGGSR